MVMHTPGPWSYDRDTNRIYSVPTNLCVAAPHIATNPSCMEQWPKDAPVLAAAPEMLEALKAVEWGGEWDDGEGTRHPACPFCDALESSAEHTEDCLVAIAIAKAGGRT